VNNVIKTIVGVVALAIVLVVSGLFYIVDETEQAVITLFGEPVTIVLGSIPDDIRADFEKDLAAYEAQNDTKITIKQGADIYTKIPFLQKVILLEDRILEYDSEPTDIVTRDKKHMLVDNFARWRIVSPLRFIQTVRTENGAQSRLDDIIYSVLREQLAMSDLVEIVRTDNSSPELD
jgi:membrane protease subunit HflC